MASSRVCDGIMCIMCAENTPGDPAPIDQSQDPLRTLIPRLMLPNILV